MAGEFHYTVELTNNTSTPAYLSARMKFTVNGRDLSPVEGLVYDPNSGKVLPGATITVQGAHPVAGPALGGVDVKESDSLICTAVDAKVLRE